MALLKVGLSSRGICAVLQTSPRILVVRVTLAQRELTFSVVLHAISAATHLVQAEACWNNLGQLMRGLSKPGVDNVVLMDANTRVGSATSPSIGEVGWQTQDLGGLLIHEFLLSFNIMLSFTFF